MFYGWQLIDILTIAAVASLMVTLMIKKKLDSLKAPQNKLMLGLFLAFLLSHVAHTYFEGLMMTWTEFSKIVVTYFLFVFVIDTERKFKITIYLLILLTLLLAVQGIYQFNTGYGWAGQKMVYSSYGEDVPGRITWISIFGDPNDLGLALVLVVAMLFGFLFGKTKFISKLVSISVLGCILYAIYLTNSRGAMLALMVTGVFYFIKRSKRFMLGAILGIIFVALVFAFGPSRLSMLSSDEEAAYERIDTWYYGITLVKSNPIFGVGYKMFTDDYGLTAHNSFVLALAEAGILGLFFWVGLFYISFKGLSLVQMYDERLRNYAYGLQASLIGFAAAAFFLSRVYIPLPYILFALSASLSNVSAASCPAINTKKVRPQNFRSAQLAKINLVENTFGPRDFRNIVFASIGIIILFYGIIKIAI